MKSFDASPGPRSSREQVAAQRADFRDLKQDHAAELEAAEERWGAKPEATKQRRKRLVGRRARRARLLRRQSRWAG